MSNADRRPHQRMRHHRWIAIAVALAASCTTFSTVRSAVVPPASSGTAQLQLASAPGEVASWVWGIYERSGNSKMFGADVNYLYGKGVNTSRPYAFGGGLSGFFPYGEAYVQLDTSTRHPFGVGARIGVPTTLGSSHQLYARRDVLVRPNARVLWNSGVMLHRTGDANSHATFIGFVQGIGVQFGSGTQVFIPSASVVWGQTDRTLYAEKVRASQVFFTIGLSVTGREAPRH